MDDLDFDPFASKRVDNDRPKGPFLIREELPSKILKWKTRIHPDTKKPQLMIGFDWQRVGAERIIQSFESHVRDWTINCVKKREALDKRDVSDHAHSLFAVDPNGKYMPYVLQLRALLQTPTQQNPTANQVAVAAGMTLLAQNQQIATFVNDPATPIGTQDESHLRAFCKLTTLEWDIYRHFVDVYDSARCHFFFDIINEEMSRFLNAERIASVNQTNSVHLKWQDYLDRCLNRLKDTVESESLLTFLTKVRDDALPCYLWIAERRAQRQELERDLVVLPEAMWLAYIVNFLTADERFILKVPADKDFVTYNAGAGYTLTRRLTRRSQSRRRRIRLRSLRSRRRRSHKSHLGNH
jgi:hypothetical protein